MENSSKALLLAAGVLLGVMILTIGVYLFSSFGRYSSEMYKKMEDAQIDQFNAQFLKYYGNTITKFSYEDAANIKHEYSKETPILCTAHDIVSLANLAKQNNIDMNLDSIQSSYDENTYYIQIDVEDKLTGETSKLYNLERALDETEKRKMKFIEQKSTYTAQVKDERGRYVYENGSIKTQNQIKYYYCTDVKISDVTKKVCYMKFEPYYP